MDLLISNLAPTVTEIELRTLFERVVPVEGVKFLPGGDALVTLDSPQDAQKALAELDGYIVAGKVLSVRNALPRKERERRDGPAEG